jgi:hypothetical protein
MALVAMLCLFIFTFWQYLPESGPALGTSLLAAAAPFSGVDANAWAGTPSTYGDRLAWLTPLWIVGVGFFQARTMVAWLAAGRLRRRGVCRAPEAWRLRLMELASPMCVWEPVHLLESALAKMPVVVG